MRILLKGFVADGISEPVKKSVLLDNGLIAAVEKDIYGSSAADRTITIKNGIIAPGFIDVHGHSDISLPAAPEAESKRHQGVTCEITGNCGLSVFPLTGLNRRHLEKLYCSYGIPMKWNNLYEYMQFLDSKQVKLRTYSMCGHNTLRAAAAGYEKQKLSGNDLQQMKNMLKQALADGAPGMSAGLLYSPGCFSDDEETISLMKILAESNSVYSVHLRSEGDYLLESLTETLESAKRAELKKVVISHLKTAGKKNWQKLDEAFAIIEKYRDQGIDVRFDRYPYTESQTMLSVILPPPFDTMPDRDITLALKDENVRNTIQQALKTRSDDDWQRWRITGTTHPYWKNFIGQKYDKLGDDKINAVIDQLTFDANSATIGAAGMSIDNMHRIITHRLCMPGSDGNALPADQRFGTAHPRAFGAIAQFIRLKLDAGESIGSCVKSVSSAPAEFFNLNSIGTIQCAKKADITVFSPDDIGCKADFLSPNRFASGIQLTIVNGNVEFY